MADLVVNDDLRARFSQFGRIADVTVELRKYADKINVVNETAAGTDDDTAKAYQNQLATPTAGLSQLIDAIATMFDTTNESGQASNSVFDSGEQESTDAAANWS